MSSLAYKLGIDNSTLARLIGNLERKNLAFRQRDEHDKRIINVFLTNNGEELMLKFSDRIEFLGKNIFDDVRDAIVVDKEINVMAMFTEIIGVIK